MVKEEVKEYKVPERIEGAEFVKDYPEKEHKEYLDGVNSMLAEMRRVVVGEEHKKAIVRMAAYGLFSLGQVNPRGEEEEKEEGLGRCHVTLLSMPSLAKSLLGRTLGMVADLKYARVQMTSDLLPNDIIGRVEPVVENGKVIDFRTELGPVMCNIFHADEINRTPPKTLSALMECLAEMQVTISGKTYILEEPFFGISTMNPVESEGVYILPWAVKDRFALLVYIDFPSEKDERKILAHQDELSKIRVKKILSRGDINKTSRFILENIYLSPMINAYAVRIAQATRPEEDRYGVLEELKEEIKLSRILDVRVSFRTGIFMRSIARTLAFLRGRAYVTPSDIRKVAPDVLRGRLMLNAALESRLDTTGIKMTILDEDLREDKEKTLTTRREFADQLIRRILRKVPV